MAKTEGQVSALETLVGTEMYRGSMQRDLQENADSIIEQLDACSAILDLQGRRAHDDKQISGDVLHGIRDVLIELAESVKQIKTTFERLAEKPKLIVPAATVSLHRPQKRQ